MIAEHTFVTTFGQDEALAAASLLLSQMGFKVRTYEDRLVAKRGETKAANITRHRHLLQRIEMAFDRGRCTLAGSIMTPDQAKQVHRDMIKTALIALEGVLVHGLTNDEALQAWRDVDGRAGGRTDQPNGCGRIAKLVLIAFGVLLLLGCIIGMLSSAMEL